MLKRILMIGAILAVVGLLILVWASLTRPILVGAVIPIDTSLGNEENLFLRYFTTKHPQIGLRPVRLIIENPAPTEEEVLAAYRRLEGQEVSVIIGGVLSKDGAWLAAEAERSGVPTFGITSSSAALAGKKDAFFRLTPTNSSQAKAVAQFFQGQGIKRLAVATSVDNVAYVDPYMKVMQENFQGEMQQIPFTSGEEVAQKIREVDPDAVFTILAAKDVIQVIQAVRAWKPDMMIGSSSWGSVELLSLYSGPSLDGVYFFTLGLEVSGEENKSEITDFESTYKMTATNGSSYAVSLLRAIYKAIQQVGAERQALRTYFEIPRSYDTAYGEMSMDEFGDGTTERIILLQTMNGVMNTVETLQVK